MARRLLALPPPLVIGAVDQPALDPRVDHDHREPFRHRHRPALQAPAIDQQRMARLRPCRDELVHDPARAADKLILRPLRELCDAGRIDGEPFRCASVLATATSSEAEEDRPAPFGTSPDTARSAPWVSPSSCSIAVTPRT
jgi:hypothetical protein